MTRSSLLRQGPGALGIGSFLDKELSPRAGPSLRPICLSVPKGAELVTASAAWGLGERL